MRGMRLVLTFGLLLLAGSVAAQVPRDAAGWRAWLGPNAPAPAADALPQLLAGLTSLLDSPDPELRDDIAYGLLAKWLVRDRIVPIESRRTLLGAWLTKLRVTPGAPPDAALGRSFAALCLGLLVALDNQDPWLSPAEFERVLANALEYLRAEADVRGFDARLGWVHSVAHTADLLKFLARSEHLQPAGQATVLAAIADKLTATTVPLTCGEDERLARAVLALAAREDFAAPAFAAWLPTAWPARPPGTSSLAELAREHNRRHLLVSLHALLAVEARPAASLPAAREALAAHLRQRLR